MQTLHRKAPVRRQAQTLNLFSVRKGSSSCHWPPCHPNRPHSKSKMKEAQNDIQHWFILTLLPLCQAISNKQKRLFPQWCLSNISLWDLMWLILFNPLVREHTGSHCWALFTVLLTLRPPNWGGFLRTAINYPTKLSVKGITHGDNRLQLVRKHFCWGFIYSCTSSLPRESLMFNTHCRFSRNLNILC